MHNDLNDNDKLPAEARLKHLEQEAQFVREWVKDQGIFNTVVTVFTLLITLALAIKVFLT